MRLLPLLLVLLLLVFGLALGLSVMWRAPSAGGAGAGGAALGGATAARPATIGGRPQGHVYSGCAEEPDSVNPFTASGQVAQRLVLAFTHDTLLDRDPADGSLRPALAESYEVSTDGTTCTFTLRPGVVFSDGSRLTMADVLFGWELAKAGHLTLGFAGAAFGRIDAVDSVDERRLRVHFRGTHFAALEAVGTTWIVASRQFFHDRVRARLDPGEAMPAVDSRRFAVLLRQIEQQCGPGTGPYVLFNEPDGVCNWRVRQDLLLVRNELSWRRQVRPGTWNFDGMRILFRDSAGAMNALLRGEIDWFSGSTIDAVLAEQPQVAKHYRRLVYDYNMLGCYRIVWNCRRPPCSDTKVRQALGMLVQRDELVQACGGAATPAVAHAKPGSDAYPDIRPPAFDPAAARRLLREAGFAPELDKPLRLSLLALVGTEALRRIADLFADAARQAGIELVVRSREFAPFIAEKNAGDWDGILVFQGFEPWADPHRFLHSAGMDNEGGWHNEEADRLAEAARSERDPKRRAALWRQLHELAHREQPVTLVVHPLATVLLYQHVQGMTAGPIGLNPERGFVEPAFQRN